MAIAQTERAHVSAKGFDLRQPQDALDILATAQMGAAWSVRSALPAIADAAEAAARCLSHGGRLAYAAAGSSALMAMADALELPGTYGIPRDRIKILIAGGIAALNDLTGSPEDDELQATRDVIEAGIGDGDVLIAVTASGATPYALAAAAAARTRGAIVVGVANNPGSRLIEIADIPVCLPTPPEVIAGSTRMGAGTAQKIALNMLSTLMATRLGHVHDGYMVNVLADNIKLRGRARRIVAAITGCSEDVAERCLAATSGAVKPAILLAAGADNADAARRLLRDSGDRLRPALALLTIGAEPARQNAS